MSFFQVIVTASTTPPPTADDLITRAGQVVHDLEYIGQLIPEKGAGTLVPSAGASANNSRDNGLIPGAAVDAEFALAAASDQFDFPDDTFLDVGLGNFLVCVVGYVAPLLNAADLVGKRGGAGNPGWELVFGGAGMLTAIASDGVTPAIATVTDGQADGNVADGRRHICGLAILRDDTGGGARPNGTLYAFTEAGVSLPVELPAGALSSPGVIASLGQGRSITHAGLRFSHLLTASGTNLTAMASSAPEAVQDYAVGIHNLLVNTQAMSELREDWFECRAVALDRPIPPFLIDGTDRLLDNFAEAPEPLWNQAYFSYTAGVVSFIQSPGVLRVTATWEITLSGSATVTMEFRVGFFIGQPGEIIIKSLFRTFVTSGGSNQGNVGFLIVDLIPAVGNGLNPEFAPFLTASASRTATITTSSGALESAGRTPPG